MDVFAFDLETFLIQPGKHVPRAVSAAWSRGSEPATSWELRHFNPRFGWRECIFEALRDALRFADIVCGVNTPFDLAVVSQEFPELWPLVWQAYRDKRIIDVAITEKLIDIGKGQLGFHRAENGTVTKVKYGLADLAKRRLGLDMDKDTWRLRYGTLYETPVSEWPDGAQEYAILDAVATHCLMFSQSLENPRYLVDATQQARSGWWIHLMAAHGFRVDRKQVDTLEETVRRELGALSAHLLALGLINAKGKRDTKAAAARMTMVCEKQGLPVPKTPTGKIKLTEAECIETSDYTLEAYAKYTSFSNVLKKDVAALRLAADAGVPIQSTFDVLKETGRTGSSGGAKTKKGVERTAFGYQLQNVRRDFELSDGTKAPGVRECFVPRARHLLCSIDYGQMELHSFAQVCLDLLGRSDLATMLNAGIDIHCKLGSMMIGRTYEEVYANRKKAQWAKDARQMAKCFHPDTEVLTRNGWVKISELTMGTEVAAAQVRDGGEVTIVWEQPTRLTRNYAEELVHLQNKGIDLRITPDHRMVGWRPDVRGAKAKRARGESVPSELGRAVECNPEKLSALRAWPSAGLCHTGVSLEEERLLRLAVATQADGSYQQQYIRFGFYKQRKIDRLTSLLRAGEYERAEHKNGVNRPVQVFRLADDLSAQIRSLLDEKRFPWWWLNLSERDRVVILDEAQYWDSHVNKHDRQYQYSSTIKQNIDVLQAIASLTGRKTRAHIDRVGDDGAVKDCWKLSVKDHHTTRGGALGSKRIPHHGDVFCLTVPSDTVLVRDGGIPVITHNCGNFGLPGGLGALRLRAYAKASYGVELDEDQAIALRDQWFAMLSEARPYFSLISRLTEIDGEIVQVRSHRVRGDVGFTDAANGFFQALAADCAKDAGFYLAEACYTKTGSPLFGCRIVNFVHDEFIFEVPEDPARAHAAAMAANEIMEAAGRRWMPDVPPKSEPALMRRWYKGAEAVYENGLLRPWEPR